MKTLAFVLFLMNIGFYVWLQGMLPWLPWQPEQYESKPQPVQLSADVERLMLVGESEDPPLKTIAPEKMRLADATGLLEDEKPKTLQDEAKIAEDTHEQSLKAAKLMLAEAQKAQEEAEPSPVVPNNLRTMSVVSKVAQLPTQETAEQIEEEAEEPTASTSESTASKVVAEKPPVETPKTITEENSKEPEIVVAMAEVEKEKTESAPASEPVKMAKPIEETVAEKQPEPKPITSEQQADDFFARLAQTVQRVGNTFKRVSDDVFNERVTVPPEVVVKPEPVAPEPKKEEQSLKIAAAEKPVQPVKKASKPVKQICYEIGAYTSVAQLNKHANWLKAKSKEVKTFIDTKTVNEVDKVRVYISPNERVPAAQQRLIAQNIVMRLRHDGISDMRLMTSGTLKNSISLGVFDRYANAQRRANAIKARGYANVHLKNYYKQQKKYWLIAKMPQTQQIIASKFRKTFKQTRLDVMQHCK